MLNYWKTFIEGPTLKVITLTPEVNAMDSPPF